MSKKFYQIDEFFPAAGDQRFSLSAESPLDQVTYNIFSADDFTDAAIYDYGERKCLFPETNDPLSAFYSRFARWKAQRGADIAAAFGALKMEYNPIENYSSTETKTGTETALKTPDEWVKTTERTPDITRTETQTPTNWEKTETQTPNQWQKTETQTPNQWQNTNVQTPNQWQEQNTKSFTNYKETETKRPTDWQEEVENTYTNFHETETQTPTSWKKETKSTDPLNPSEDFNKVVPFNGSTTETVSATLHFVNDTEEQKGTFETDRTTTGSKAETKTTSGTFATDLEKTGTETDTKTQSGSFTTTDTQSGTYTTTETQNGTFVTTDAQTGTYETETVESGTDTTTETQEGTFEDKMTYDTVLTRKGNIGVTTSQQMVRSEWFDLRRNQFVKEVIKEFFNNVSVYC